MAMHARVHEPGRPQEGGQAGADVWIPSATKVARTEELDQPVEGGMGWVAQPRPGAAAAGVQVAGAIAKSLFVVMLIPLGLALLVRAYAPETAAAFKPVMMKSSSLAILVLMVVGLGLNVSNILGLLGTGGILALLMFIAASLRLGSSWVGETRGRAV